MGESEVDQAQRVARAVLYEGYLLWPYRRSALKNRQRWTIGGIYPEPYSAQRDDDPCRTRTQIPLAATPEATLDVRVRFLHVVTRDLGRWRGERLEPVAELVAGGERHLAWEEATEREVAVTGGTLAALADVPHHQEFDIPAGQHTEWVETGAVRRHWRALRGRVELSAERLAESLFRVTVEVVNTSGYAGRDRPEALRHTFVSAHTVLRCGSGEFVSLLDPPDPWRRFAQSCENVGTWPVLVGEEGDRHTVLSAPIILYDHPQVAPESPGDLFDATEIDQLLTLNILGLTDEERREMRDSDPRAREILDRCESLSAEQLMALHGTMREVSRR